MAAMFLMLMLTGFLAAIIGEGLFFRILKPLIMQVRGA